MLSVLGQATISEPLKKKKEQYHRTAGKEQHLMAPDTVPPVEYNTMGCRRWRTRDMTYRVLSHRKPMGGRMKCKS